MQHRNLLKDLTTLLFSCLLWTNSAQAEQLVLRYSQWIPPSHWSQAKGMYPWFDKIAEVTEGRVIVEPSKRPLVPPAQSYQAVIDGKVDLASAPHGYTPGRYPLSELVEQPLTNPHAAHSSTAYWRIWEEHFKPTGMHDGVEILGMTLTPGGNLYMRDQLVDSVLDLSGKRIRIPTRVIGRAFDDIGVDSVIGQLRSVGQLMNTGAVDGTALVDGWAIQFGIARDVKAVTRIPGGLYSSSVFIAINKDKWNKISPEDQAAIRAISGEKLGTRLGYLAEEAEAEAREVLKAQLGENYHTASEGFIAELDALFKVEQNNWIAAAEEIGVDGKEAIETYKRIIAEEQENPTHEPIRVKAAALTNE